MPPPPAQSPDEEPFAEPGTPLYEALRTTVLDGSFPRGALLQEASLGERFGVSRTPVREALARLEHDGLVERVARGYRIRSGTGEDVLEIYEARIALEAQAAAGAAERRTPLDLARLRHLLDAAPTLAASEQPEGEDGLGAERARHSAWHTALWRAGHNATISHLLVRLTAQLRIYDRGTVEADDALAANRDEHAAIVEALQRRDPDAARELMTAHLVRSREVRLRRFVVDVESEA